MNTKKKSVIVYNTKPDRYITFEGKKYKCWDIEGFLVSETRLQSQLFVQGFYVSKRAREVDEKIAYFVSENERVKDVLNVLLD